MAYGLTVDDVIWVKLYGEFISRFTCVDLAAG